MQTALGSYSHPFLGEDQASSSSVSIANYGSAVELAHIRAITQH